MMDYLSLALNQEEPERDEDMAAAEKLGTLRHSAVFRGKDAPAEKDEAEPLMPASTWAQSLDQPAAGLRAGHEMMQAVGLTTHRESADVMWGLGRQKRAGIFGSNDVISALSRVHRQAEFPRTQSRRFRITLPEDPVDSHERIDAETLDRAVERDARRYDGGFALY